MKSTDPRNISSAAPGTSAPPGAVANAADLAARPLPRSPRGWHAAAWIVAYLVLTAFPLLVLLLGKMPTGGGFWWDFAMALGFGGLAIMGLQSGLTARFRRATAPFGADIIYYFHRWVAVAAFGLIAIHYIILRARYGAALGPLNPLEASWHMTAGRLAFLLFGVLIVTSLWRKPLRIEYDRWRAGHAVMAVAAVALAVVHIQGVGHYTHAAWRGLVWVGFTAVWVLVIGYVRLVRPWTLWRRPYRVTDVRAEHGRVWTVTLAPEGHAGMTFRPGQFAWLTLRASPFRAKEHPFSFSGSAAEPAGVLRFTIKELGDFTRTIKDVKPGERAYVDGPHGVFTTDEYPQAEEFVFVAGGIGIAPILSMLRTLADRGDPRPLRLVYGNRCWENVAFREELDALPGRLRLTVVHVLQESPAGWTGLEGVLSEPVLQQAIPGFADSAVFFLCGPKAMSDAVQHALRRRGVALRRIRCELFDMA
ncbi:MAG TPA: ferric reductase-like transmembrane domain-containing protein [Opitutaceae bacterium]